jgi:membrane protein DedA with SNARE-associated domain
LLEAIAVIGSVLPGSTIVFAGGMLVGLKALDPWLTATAAVLGAILGDGVSYWFGRRYHQAIRSMWPLSSHPMLVVRGEAYFTAHGGKSVFLGRFLGPLRAMVPLVAGMSNMPPAHFYAMNVLSALAWAAAHLLPGALFGASLQLAGAVSARLVALIAIVTIILWSIAYVIRLVVRIGWPYVRLLQHGIVRRSRQPRGRLAQMVLSLVDPARPEAMALLVAATVLIGGAWLFLGVVEDVVTRDSLVQVDQAFYEALQGTRIGWMDDIMLTITSLGSAYVTVAVVAAVALWLIAMRRWQTLWYWIGAVAFAELLVLALKAGMERQRPETVYSSVDPYSFPSGHAALSIVVYGFLAFLLAHGKPGWQKIGVALPAAAIAALIAFSRLYLGVHWFSDVVASLGLGLAWIGLLCIAYINHVDEKPLRAAPMLIVVLTTLTFFGTAYGHRYHERDSLHYAKPATARSLTLAGWQEGEWRTLPPARAELRGKQEEPFTVQWVATPDGVAEVLTATQWRAPPPWKSRATLLWLVPSTPIDELPVLPKLHQGQAPALTFVRPVDARHRLVIRLWHLADVSDDRSPHRWPLWSGMVTLEEARTEFGLIATARTTGDVSGPLQAVDQAARRGGLIVETRGSGEGPVLLIR